MKILLLIACLANILLAVFYYYVGSYGMCAIASFAFGLSFGELVNQIK